MNKTKIEWCDMTWNPVTGCLHGCPYCYARKQAMRFGGGAGNGSLHDLEFPETKLAGPSGSFYAERTDPPEVCGEFRVCPYPYGFDPTFRRYRLDEPQAVKKPQDIFVCSMADLFGGWVPGEWIKQVFEACEKAPWHRYLFLTKNPGRYLEFLESERKNIWTGATVTNNADFSKKSYDDFFGSNKHTHHHENVFLSVEPMQEPVTLSNLANVKWVIIGAETGNRKGKVIPKREWVENLTNACAEAGIPVFMKNSLAGIWGGPLLQEYPRQRGNNL